MAVLLYTHHQFLEHHTGVGHPERAGRLHAVRSGLAGAGLEDALELREPTPGDLDAIRRVHPGTYVDHLREFVEHGGGHIDGDTVASSGSFEAARLAVGAGLDAVDAIDAGEATSAFCAVRPPGHHATPHRPMGFCLFNSVGVVARKLADRGERVLIVDIDAHHGNGTQDIFYGDGQVVYASIHEYPMYPGTGGLDEIGAGPGRGATINVPVPAGATGDVFREAVERVLAPMAALWEPTWVLVSAGFDAHRRDPITGLGLSSGDYADVMADLLVLAPAAPTVVYLEGGYDLDAVASCTVATVGAMLGERLHPEAPTSGGPGTEIIDAVGEIRHRLADGG